MSDVDYAAVLAALHPGAQYAIYGDSYSDIAWMDDSPKPDQADLDAAWADVQTATAWAQVRAQRDGLLEDCDWTVLADAPLTAAAKTAWKAYRQQLREIPQTYDDPADVVWPVAP